MAERLPSSTSRSRDRERRPRRARGALTWLIRLVVIAAVFFAGLALGRSLGESGETGGTQTLVRTLQPTTLTPLETVTVTVSNP